MLRLARLQPWYLLTRYPNRFTKSVFAFVNGSLAIGIISCAAVYTNQPLIFPSLGPSAFLFFYLPAAAVSSPRNAILGHGAGVLTGIISFWVCASLFGEGTSAAQIGGAALSLGLISAVMIGLNIPHPPAASTALMLSLGFMTSGQEAGAIMVAVLLLVGQAYLFNRLSGVYCPLWQSPSQVGQARLVVAPLHTEKTASRAETYAAIADQLVAREPVAAPESAKR